MTIRLLTYLVTALFAGGTFVDSAAGQAVNTLKTASGVPFAIWGGKPAAPAPTVFIFSDTAALSLSDRYFRQSGTTLAAHGFLCVSLDDPGFGAFGSDDVGGLVKWRTYTDAGRNFVPEFSARIKKVLDYLIAQRYSDPKQIVAIGTSKGGYLAMQFAAAEPRVKAVASFAPVTDFARLKEFAGAEQQPLIKRLALKNQANNLAGRLVWMSIGATDRALGPIVLRRLPTRWRLPQQRSI